MISNEKSSPPSISQPAMSFPGIGLILAEVLFNMVLPFLIYIWLDSRFGDVGALLFSMVPPTAWALVGLVRKKKIDLFSVFIVVGIALSILLALGTHSARMLQLRENLVTLVIGIVFLGSVAIRRPLIYQFALAAQRKRGEEQAASFAQLNREAGFRRSMMVITLVWGCGLVAVFAVSVALIYSLSIPQYLIVGPIVAYAMIGLIIAWTVWYVRRAKRRGAAAAQMRGVTDDSNPPRSGHPD